MSELIPAEMQPADDRPPPGCITIGIRHYDAATGEITTVREPVTFEGTPTGSYTSRMELCSCPQEPACHHREREVAR